MRSTGTQIGIQRCRFGVAARLKSTPIKSTTLPSHSRCPAAMHSTHPAATTPPGVAEHHTLVTGRATLGAPPTDHSMAQRRFCRDCLPATQTGRPMVALSNAAPRTAAAAGRPGDHHPHTAPAKEISVLCGTAAQQRFFHSMQSTYSACFITQLVPLTARLAGTFPPHAFNKPEL